MLNPNVGPRDGLVIRLMAVIVICLTPAMHPIAVPSITAYAMTAHSRQQRHPDPPGRDPGRAFPPGAINLTLLHRFCPDRHVTFRSGEACHNLSKRETAVRRRTLRGRSSPPDDKHAPASPA